MILFRRRAAAGLAVLTGLVAAATVPSAGADEVTVSVANAGGTRTMAVESVDGQPLTELSLDRAGTRPFRVRVTDTDMDTSSFQVVATMTNLYAGDGGGGLDFDSFLPSDAASLDVNGAAALGLLGVGVLAEPVYDLAGTVPEPLCTAITLLGISCALDLDDVQGLGVDLDIPDLLGGAVPLVQTAGTGGIFTDPDYVGAAAADPNKPPVVDPTAVPITDGTAGITPGVLAAADAALATLAGVTPADELVDLGVLQAALRDTIGAAYDLLSIAQIDGLIDALAATPVGLLTGQILGLDGTYLTYPTLTVAPGAGAPTGSFTGTLTVTLVQL